MYAAMIAAVDDGVGEIMAAVKAAGLTENTMVVFVGDNGATTEKRAGLNQEFATAGVNGAFRGFKVQPLRRRHARAGYPELARHDPAQAADSRARHVDGHSTDDV